MNPAHFLQFSISAFPCSRLQQQRVEHDTVCVFCQRHCFSRPNESLMVLGFIWQWISAVYFYFLYPNSCLHRAQTLRLKSQTFTSLASGRNENNSCASATARHPFYPDHFLVFFFCIYFFLFPSLKGKGAVISALGRSACSWCPNKLRLFSPGGEAYAQDHRQALKHRIKKSNI